MWAREAVQGLEPSLPAEAGAGRNRQSDRDLTLGWVREYESGVCKVKKEIPVNNLKKSLIAGDQKRLAGDKAPSQLMRVSVRWGACFLMLAFVGCAGLDVAPVSDDKTDLGYRYYAQAPFLFVRSDGKGGLTSEIIFLPDTTQEMSAQPYAYLATNNTTLSFDKGTLTEANVVGDETVVPVALADALGKAASAAIAANAPAILTATAPVPYLFKIKVDGSKVELNGGPAFGTDGKQAVITLNVVIPTAK